jgi:hypothetical protein
MSNSASSGNAALPHDNVGGYHHYPDCQGGPDCDCDDELDMESLKVGSIIRYWGDRLMVEQIDREKEVVCASCAMDKEFEIPFGEFDVIH